MKKNVIKHIEKGRVFIFVIKIGIPSVTTDTS